MEPRNRVQWVYAAEDNAQLAERYDQWASDYEADLDRDFGYSGPADAAEIFVRHVPLDAKILDAGAGTGLVGLELKGRGYAKILAMDMSEGMLEQARSKGVYQELHRMVMGEPLDFETDAFDAVISVGVLTLGHATADSLDELVRVTRPADTLSSRSDPTSTKATASGRSKTPWTPRGSGAWSTSRRSSGRYRRASRTCTTRSGYTRSARLRNHPYNRPEPGRPAPTMAAGDISPLTPDTVRFPAH